MKIKLSGALEIISELYKTNFIGGFVITKNDMMFSLYLIKEKSIWYGCCNLLSYANNGVDSMEVLYAPTGWEWEGIQGNAGHGREAGGLEWHWAGKSVLFPYWVILGGCQEFFFFLMAVK